MYCSFVAVVRKVIFCGKKFHFVPNDIDERLLKEIKKTLSVSDKFRSRLDFDADVDSGNVSRFSVEAETYLTKIQSTHSFGNLAAVQFGFTTKLDRCMK